MKKYLTLLACGLFASTMASAEAQNNGLPPEAAGKYVIVDKANQPAQVLLEIKLNGKQWLADGSKDGGRTWYPICRADEHCKLGTSSKQDIQRFLAHSSKVLKEAEVNCIHNQAFALCQAKNSEFANYAMIVLNTGNFEVIPLMQVK